MEQGANKRRFERVKIDSEKIYDLSEGGMYIRTSEPKRLGSLIVLEIKLFENEPPIRVKARVLRIIYQRGAPKRFPPGMAVEFVDLGEREREWIKSYVLQKKRK